MTLGEKFRQVQSEKSALLATNFYNFETLHSVGKAARLAQKPLILQLTRSSIEYMGLRQAVNMARTEIAEQNITAWLHLDHGDSVELARQCIEAGFDSVMIDASEQPFATNIATTRQVVELAHARGVLVEAELGYVAKLGQSDQHIGFTDPAQAAEFVAATGVDSLAVAIGTAHGFYKQPPKLDLDRLEQITRAVSVPLVLHGGSGIPDDALREAVERGICKVNLATEIKNAFMRRVRADLTQTDEIDLRKVFPPAMDVVVALVAHKLSVVTR